MCPSWTQTQTDKAPQLTAAGLLKQHTTVSVYISIRGARIEAHQVRAPLSLDTAIVSLHHVVVKAVSVFSSINGKQLLHHADNILWC